MTLALLVRVIGVFPGYPANHPDEPASYITALHMLFNFLAPNRIDYPAGVPLAHLIFYVIFFIPIQFIKIFIADPQFKFDLFNYGIGIFDQYKISFFGYGSINALYWSRYVAVLFGTAAVFLLYLCGKKLFNRNVGLFAAFFLAFNFRHVLASHFGLPDIHGSFFAILSLLASILLFEKNTRRRYIFAGISVAFFLSIKFQLFALGPYLVSHLIWVFRKKDWKYLFNKNFIISLISIPIVFLLINPYLFVDMAAFIERTNYTMFRYQAGYFHFQPYPYFDLYHWGIGELPGIAIVVGLLLLMISNFRKFLILFSFVFLLFFMMTYYTKGGNLPRNFVSGIPYLMIFAGFFMDTLYRLLLRVNKTVAVAGVIVILLFVNLSSIKNSVTLSYNYAKPWNINLLANWLKINIPSETTIRRHPILFSQQDQIALENKNIRILIWEYYKGPNSLAEFQDEGTQFVILNTQEFQLATYWWRGWNDSKRFLKLSSIPFDYLQNGFHGLSLKELINYTVYEVYKPWQSYGASNYLVFKIPNKPKEVGKRVAYFDFASMDEAWKIRGIFDFVPISAEWTDDDGKNKKGAMVINKGAGVPTSRLSSSPIPIKPLMFYTVRGFIKNSPEDAKAENEGFLRIDFHKDSNETAINNLGISVALSKRAPVNGEWTQVEVSMLAPDNSRYLTVSFQRRDPWRFSGNSFKENQAVNFSSYLDEVEVFETNKLPEEPFKEIPYIKSTIPLESIYYDSFL